MIDIALVGTGGMMPLHNRVLASMLARINGRMLLFDCGEGTQVSIRQLGWGFKSIDYICFTHFHADHISGLPGLLLTIGNSDRTEPLTVVGPRGLQRIVKSLCAITPGLPFDIQFVELFREPAKLPLGEITLSALPVNHGMDCMGYSFTLPRAGKFDAEAAKALGLPVKTWSRLQAGETVEYEEKTYTPDMVMGPQRKGLKVSYITDTRPTKDIPAFIQDSDLFICEGLYGDDDKLEKARSHHHMIFSEAARLAQKGNARELWLTHYSPAMPDPYNYLDFAKRIFENSKLGRDGMTVTLAFE